MPFQYDIKKPNDCAPVAIAKYLEIPVSQAYEIVGNNYSEAGTINVNKILSDRGFVSHQFPFPCNKLKFAIGYVKSKRNTTAHAIVIKDGKVHDQIQNGKLDLANWLKWYKYRLCVLWIKES